MDADFFQKAIRAKGWSLREFTTMMGLGHHAQISRIFSGERRMQLDEAVKFSELLGVSFEEVVAHAGYPQILQGNHRVQVVGVLTASGEVETVRKTERAIAPAGIPKDAIAIQARTADTKLAWMDAWVFFCKKTDGIAEGAVGRFCYAKIAGGPRIMTTIRRGYASGTFNLAGPYSTQSASLEWAEPIILTRN